MIQIEKATYDDRVERIGEDQTGASGRSNRQFAATRPSPSRSGHIEGSWLPKQLTLLGVAAVLCASGGLAQTTTQVPGTAAAVVVPLAAKQPRPRIFVDRPLAEPLARGVVVLQYRTENIRIVPVFGQAALQVSPRVGHLHVTLDNLPWDWADASGVPVIIQNLPAGPHRVLIELADANHNILDHGAVSFVVPDVGQQSRSMMHQGSP
jgi:hypothetical protein